MGVTIRPRQGQQIKTNRLPKGLSNRIKAEFPNLSQSPVRTHSKADSFQIPSSVRFVIPALLHKTRVAPNFRPDLKSRFPFGDNPNDSPTLKAWYSELKNERPNPVLLQYLQDHHEKIMSSQVWKSFSKGAFSESRVELILKQLQELNPSEFAYRKTSAFSFEDLIGIDFFLQVKLASKDYYLPIQVKSSQSSIQEFLKQEVRIEKRIAEHHLGLKQGSELKFKHKGILVLDGTSSLSSLKATVEGLLANTKSEGLSLSSQGKAIIPIPKNEYDQLTGLERNQFLLKHYTIINS